jgi:hypothetical protein
VKAWTYNKEIQTLIEQFTSAFNDIVIKRFAKNSNVPQSQFKVNFVYAPKQRVVETLKKPAPGGLTVPVVAVNIASIQRDQSRVFNKVAGFNIDALSITGEDREFVKGIRQPVPINIGVNMTIITKYQTDMDQIISNFVPYCDPYIVISWKMPVAYGKDYEIRSEVLWSGNVNVQYPLELGPNQSFRITADTSFTIKGWLFKSVEYNESYKKIYVVNTDYVPVNEDDLKTDALITDLEEYETQSTSISARPQIRYVSPTSMYFLSGADTTTKGIEIYGESFSSLTNIYLSASNPNIFTTPVSNFAPFSGNPIQQYYPAFNAVPVSAFSYDSGLIYFELPQLNMNLPPNRYPITLDIIVQNEAGYGVMTKDIKNIKNKLFYDSKPSSFFRGTSGIKINQLTLTTSPLSEFTLYSINGEPLLTIDGDFLINII